MKRYNFLAIEGNIGSGKTSLAKRIAADYDAKLILEEFDDNPFLPRFYKDPERYSFQLELSFLAERYQQLKNNLSNRELFHPFTVSDYIFYKSLIFARTNLEEEEYQLYSKLFSIIYSVLPKPDLLAFLYLPVDRLQANIHKRGRTYEQEIPSDYLERVQQSYFDFFKQEKEMRILIIDTRDIDFVNRPADYETMVDLLSQDYPIGVHQIIPNQHP